MLISMDTGQEVDYTPHDQEWQVWRSRLSANEWQAISDELNQRFDSDEIQTAGWIPGGDWTGTVFEPIYSRACRGNFDASALCFGLAVWEIVRARDDRWGFGRYELNGQSLRSMTYFRLANDANSASPV